MIGNKDVELGWSGRIIASQFIAPGRHDAAIL